MILAVVFPQEVCTPALPNASPSPRLSGAFGGLPCFCSFSIQGLLMCFLLSVSPSTGCDLNFKHIVCYY